MQDCLDRVCFPNMQPIVVRDRCIVSITTPEYLDLLADLVGSLQRTGSLQGAQLIVLAVDCDTVDEGTIRQLGALSISCRSLCSPGMTLKAALYSIAHIVEAQEYLCLDADMLILESITPIFDLLASLPQPEMLVCRQGNGRGYRNLEQAMTALYQGQQTDFNRLLGAVDTEPHYRPVVNDGIFAGNREAMMALDATIRAMPYAAAWLDEAPRWGRGSQFILNLALARMCCGLELDHRYNLQLNDQDVTVSFDNGRPSATWCGRQVKALHFNARGRNKYHEWRAEIRRRYGTRSNQTR
jgi:hypothetical protein